MAGFGIMNLNFKFGLPKLFGRTSAIEAEIDEFLDGLTEGGLIFHKALRLYLDEGPTATFEELVEQVAEPLLAGRTAEGGGDAGAGAAATWLFTDGTIVL